MPATVKNILTSAKNYRIVELVRRAGGRAGGGGGGLGWKVNVDNFCRFRFIMAKESGTLFIGSQLKL